MRSMRSHVITASWVDEPRFVTWGDWEGRGRLRHILMKHTLKLGNSDHRIVNRGRTYSGCLGTRKKTTRLMMFPLVIFLLSVALRDVMTWFFTVLVNTMRSIKRRSWKMRCNQDNIQRRQMMVRTPILFKNKFLDNSIKWRKRRVTKENSSGRFKVLTETHHKLCKAATILVLGKKVYVFNILEGWISSS